MEVLHELFYRRNAWAAPLIANCLLAMLKAFLVSRNAAHCIQAALFFVFGLLLLSVMLWAFSMMTSHIPSFAAMFAAVTFSMLVYSLATTIAVWSGVSLNAAHFIAGHPDNTAASRAAQFLLNSLDVSIFAEIGVLSFAFARLTRVRFIGGLAAVLPIWILLLSSLTLVNLLL